MRFFELFESEKSKNDGKESRSGDENSEVFERENGERGKNNANEGGAKEVDKEKDSGNDFEGGDMAMKFSIVWVAAVFIKMRFIGSTDFFDWDFHNFLALRS